MSPSLDAYVPSALVHVIITEYLCPQSWATLLRTSRGERDTVALAAKVHPWSGRARLVRALVHNGTPLYASPRATLSETLAVLHHCHVAHAAGGAGGAVVVSVCETLELAVPHAGAPNEQTLRLVARGVRIIVHNAKPTLRLLEQTAAQNGRKGWKFPFLCTDLATKSKRILNMPARINPTVLATPSEREVYAYLYKKQYDDEDDDVTSISDLSTTCKIVVLNYLAGVGRGWWE